MKFAQYLTESDAQTPELQKLALRVAKILTKQVEAKIDRPGEDSTQRMRDRAEERFMHLFDQAIKEFVKNVETAFESLESKTR